MPPAMSWATPNWLPHLSHKGRLAVCHMFDIPAAEIGQTMPFSIYSIPEMSSVGLTEKRGHRRRLRMLLLGEPITVT